MRCISFSVEAPLTDAFRSERIRTGNLDGIQLIAALRSLQNYAFIPILMLTTESQPEKKDAGRKAGATGWIVKPFNGDQLLAVVQKLVH